MWSRAARVRLFSAFLRLLPPRAGNGGSSSAMKLGLTPGLLGTAVPTVAVWTGSPFGFALEEIQKLVHSYLSELPTGKKVVLASFIWVHTTFFEWAAGHFGEKVVKLAELSVGCRSIFLPLKQGLISSSGQRSDLKNVFLFLLAKQNMHVIS